MESNIKEFKNVYFIPEIKGTILNKKYYEYILLDSNKKRINYKNKNFNINNIENFLKNENIIHINDKCIYIGLHTKHYGHFLIETLSSFWIFLNNNTIENLNDYKYIFTKGRLRNDSIDNLNNGLTRYIFKCFNINYDNVIRCYISKAQI